MHREQAGFNAQQAEDGIDVRATSRPENKRVDQTAICPYCEARVPFLIESSEAA